MISEKILNSSLCIPIRHKFSNCYRFMEQNVEFGLPKELIDKTPSDGLSGLSDEAKLGFSYKVLDRYIQSGVCEDHILRHKKVIEPILIFIILLV